MTTAEGVLLSTGAAGCWAWTGLRLAPARGLAEHRAYADVPEEERRRQAVAAELAWLQAQCRPGERLRYDLRYVSEPGSSVLRCVLLAQAAAGTPQEAGARAVRLRERLAALPSHVQGRPILEDAELLAALDPFGGVDGSAGSRGLVEIRKRLTAVRFSRPDTDRQFAVTVADLGTPGASWEPVWAELIRQPVATLLSVALEPEQLGRPALDELGRYAAEYRRLASAGRTAGPWQRVLPPDPAAWSAAEVFEAALRRGVLPGYRLRITLAAAGPVPGELAALVAHTVGGSANSPVSGLANGLVSGPVSSVANGPASGHGSGAAVLPVAPADEPAAWSNLTGLNLQPLDHTYRQGLPDGHYGWAEQTLSGHCELVEVCAALRLPYEVPAHRPLFDDRFATHQGAGPTHEPTAPTAAPARPPGRRPPI